MSTREHWGSRFGFIMAAAGSAVGLGNIWRFPYITGENGGGAFLVIYLGIVIGFGLSLMMAEMLVGRSAQRNPVGAFRQLGGKGWPLVGFLGVLTGFVILSFYIVVAGWTLSYIGQMARGLLHSRDPAVLGAAFEGFVADPWRPLAYAAVFMVLVAWVVTGGISRGIERANRWLMPILFLLLLVLVTRALTLPGAAQGMAFYLTPDWSKVDGGTFFAAISQVFFSFSIGMGTMLTYGSYLSLRENLPRSALTVGALDCLAAFLSGLMVIPAVFAFGFSPSAGPGLTFITLPAVFAALPGGDLFGMLFFTLLAIAALTSAVSILEPLVSYVIDEHGLPRRVVVAGASVVCFLLAVPASLSFGPWSEVTVFGKTWFDLMDFLANNLMLPVGGLLTALFVGWAWGRPALTALSNEHQLHQPWAVAWLWILRVVAPVAITWILITNLS